MLFRDYMQKFRPLYAPPDAPGAAAVGDSGAAVASSGAVADVGAAAVSAAPEPTLDAGSAAAAPTPAEPAAPETPAAEPPKAEPTLLEEATGKKPEESPAPAEAEKVEGEKPETKEGEGDKKPEAEPAKTDPETKDATAAEPPAPIKYDTFKVPDGIKLDDKDLAKFTEVAGKAQIPQDVAQSLMDLYIDERKQDMARAEQHQRDVWKKLNDTWKSEFRKDEQLGGNRSETTLARAKAVLEEYGGSPDQVRELIAHTSNNGMGNFPGFIRLLNNIGEALNVFEDSDVPANPNPPKIAGSRSDRWYGGSMGKGAAKP